MSLARLCLILMTCLGIEAGLALALSTGHAGAGNFTAPPSYMKSKATALSDEAFSFRSQALAVQHTGNLNGVIVPYYQLNYAHLAEWLALLDRLDGAAQITPTMAAFLFGNSQNGADTRYIIDYLERRAMADPANNWRWLGQAVYLARYKLKDTNRAQVLAHELSTLPIALPSWARDMEVFVLVDRGDKAGAKRLLDSIATADPDLPDNERRWIKVYAERNLQ